MSAHKLSWITGLWVILSSRTVAAQASSSPGTVGATVILESLALVLVFACILVTFKLYRTIRGGRISRGWRWFLFGFMALGLAQLLLFGGHIGVVPTWNGGILVDVLRVFSVFSLLIGVTRFRKLLA